MNFDIAFGRLVDHEGGYTPGVGDPGGETKFGISKRAYPSIDIKSLTRDQARTIYLADFWNRINANALYDGVAFQLFDFAVNSGIETAIRYYQRALGVADDGHWGPVSARAADSLSETDQIMKINAERLDFMSRLSNWPTASRGWARRIAGNLRYGAEDS